MNANVVMLCRDKARGEAALAEIQEQSGDRDVELMLADFSSQRSIRQFQVDVLHLFVLGYCYSPPGRHPVVGADLKVRLRLPISSLKDNWTFRVIE